MLKEVEVKGVINENKCVFDDKYIIPIYQREYAWGNKQIEELIEDVAGIEGNSEYYLGTLIVDKKDNHGDIEYYVIDGQQRLTTLYLIINYYNSIKRKINFDEISINNSLVFECRDKSNITLDIKTETGIKYLCDDICYENGKNIDEKQYSSEIINGIRTIKKIFEKNKNNIDNFVKNLSKAKFIRVKVPANADLNKYFEIMNTRGKQLSQVDIVKGKLLEKLNEQEQIVYSELWSAISNMDGYVQKNLDKELREIVFGENLNELLIKDFDYLMQKMHFNDKNKSKQVNSEKNDDNDCIFFEDIINKPKFKSINNEDKEGSSVVEDDDIKTRFNSIISFEYFLLHIMKRYAEEKKLTNSIEIIIDDKRIYDNYKAIAKKLSDPKKIQEFSKEIIILLINARFLFDKYIIKRDHGKEMSDKEGKWSLKRIKKYNKTIGFVNTCFKSDENITNNEDANQIENDENKDYDTITKALLMIEAALRVSYTSPKNMNWLYKAIDYLLEKDIDDEGTIVNELYNTLIEFLNSQIKEFVQNEKNFSLGVSTPHIVFNYLDYLLWKNDNENYKDFEFQFRNSVEHFYPRNPSDFESWNDNEEETSVDYFGNLCLLPSSINSKFSNYSPIIKCDKIKNKDYIFNMPIKMRIMKDIIESDPGDGNKNWKKTECKRHGEEMIDILKKECGLAK